MTSTAPDPEPRLNSTAPGPVETALGRDPGAMAAAPGRDPVLRSGPEREHTETGPGHGNSVGAGAFGSMVGGETHWGAVLGPVSVRRIACDAAVTRVVLDGLSQPLDVGRRTRVVPPAIRTALVVRDRGCVWPGCDRPPQWTDAHHVVHWADGGPTSIDNLVLLCRRHHRAVHEGRSEVPHAPPRAA